MAPSKKADYIIVGGGIAGCTLASRLHRGDPSLSILLIEAGADLTNHPLMSLPAPHTALAAHNTDLDWAFTTAPQQHLLNRELYVPAGKALSGGSATNYGTWIRGAKIDYDTWAERVGDQRWSYNGLLPYFRRIEHYHDSAADPNQHGFGGPVRTATMGIGCNFLLRQPIREAWARVGTEWIPDSNAGFPLGLSSLTENWPDGKRHLASEFYDIGGVQVMTQTLVKRVIIEEKDGVKVATGVELDYGEDYTATKEVIISVGAVRTPQLLMLSGIGPANDLSRHGIKPVVENSEVGANLFDHLVLWQAWKLRHPEQGLTLGTPLWNDKPEYNIGKLGDWVVFGQTPHGPLIKALNADQDDKDQDRMLDPSRCHTETILIYIPAGLGYSEADIIPDGTHISSLMINVMPTARGSITLASSDPKDQPVMNPNYYSNEVDRAVMREGVRKLARVMLDTKELQEAVVGETPPSGFTPLTSQSTDDEIDDRFRKVGKSFWHVGGSASMGKVVDTQLKVFGVRNLRVVDTSVMPVPLAAHYQVCVYAMAELAADMILGKV